MFGAPLTPWLEDWGRRAVPEGWLGAPSDSGAVGRRAGAGANSRPEVTAQTYAGLAGISWSQTPKEILY